MTIDSICLFGNEYFTFEAISKASIIFEGKAAINLSMVRSFTKQI
jgi:hypothetical protein